MYLGLFILSTLILGYIHLWDPNIHFAKWLVDIFGYSDRPLAPYALATTIQTTVSMIWWLSFFLLVMRVDRKMLSQTAGFVSRLNKAMEARLRESVPSPTAMKAAFIVSLSLVALLVWSYRSVYFRDYADTPQSSIGSAHAHGLAMASTDIHGPVSFIVARQFDHNGKVIDYPHYTNGFPLFLRGFFALFGNSVITARAFALLLFLVGAYCFAFALAPEKRIPALSAVPLVLATSTGRDATTFVLLEPAQTFILGLSALVLLRYNRIWIRQSLIFFAAFFYEMTLAFPFAMSVLYFLHKKEKKIVLTDILGLALAGALVLLAFIISSGGLDPVIRIVLHRTSIDTSHLTYFENITMSELLKTLRFDLIRNFGDAVIWFVPLALILSFFRPAKGALLTALIAFLGYALLFRNHVGYHLFTRLPLILLVTIALSCAINRLVALVFHSATGYLQSLLFFTGVLALLSLLLLFPQRYDFDQNIALQQKRLTLFVDRNKEILNLCSTFDIEGNIDNRLIQYHLNDFFLQAKKNKRGKHCRIDLTEKRSITVVNLK